LSLTENTLKSGHRFLSYLALIGTLFNFIVYPAYAMVEHFPYGVRSHIYYPFVRPSDPSPEVQAETVHKQDGTSAEKEKTVHIKSHKNTSTVSTETGFEIYAAEPLGVIGYNNSSGSDDPSDNIFRFDVDKKLLTGKQLTLSYDVYGIENASGVARSINEHTATGGYFAKKSTAWKTVEEVISIDQLKEGMNHILFTTFENQKLDYKVKNLKLTALPAVENTYVHLADGNMLYEKDGKAYVKGTVLLNAAQLSINGKDVAVRAGEFETVLENASEVKSLKITLIKNGQAVYSEELPVSVHHEVSDALGYKAPEVRYGIRTTEEGTYNFGLDAVDFKITAAQYAKADQITVQQLREVDRAPLGTNIVNVTSGKSAYRFLPEGAKFSEKVPLTLAYDKNLLPKGYNENDIQVLYFDLQKRSWVAVETDTIALDEQKITGLTDHFTDYMAGVIQAPESPETSSFTPTTISGIQAANPTAGIVQIQPPVANQKGDGTVDFPIVLPPGRGGLTPSLSVTYNNNGGSGPVGYGWDIPVQTISVDSRFGTPLYSTSQETESYQFNGEDLLLQSGTTLYQPHRPGTFINRVTDATFVPKVEGAFSKIVRKGTSPANYYWIVYDKSGKKYYYGNVTKISSGTGGNISKWYLDKVEDVNGNYISYHYQNFSKSTQDNLNGAVEFQLAIIMYSRNNSLEASYNNGTLPWYQVNLTYNSSKRNDSFFSYRNGFKEANAVLLQKITVTSMKPLVDPNGQPDGPQPWVSDFETNYLFNYENGQFGKVRLRSIMTQNKKNNADAAGGASTDSYTHNFEYYNDVEGGQLFAAAKEIKTEKDFSNDKYAALSATKESYSSWEVNVGAGVSPAFNPPVWWPFSFSGTINFAFPSDVSTSSKPSTMLLDIDGDGLDDKVIKTENEGIKYRKNLGGLAFSKQLYKVTNLMDLGWTESMSSTKPEMSLSLLFGSFSASKSQSNARSRSFFTDANADGLLDYVKDRIVYFGYIDPKSDLPTFTANSELTPNLIRLEGSADPAISAPLPDLSIGNDLMDVVKVWVAPAKGQVNISGTITKNFVASHNGVRYSVEKSGGTPSLHFSSPNFPIKVYDPRIPLVPWDPVDFIVVGPAVPINNNTKEYIVQPTLLVEDSMDITKTVNVELGDHIYFRVNSSQLPDQAVEVDWDPIVQYVGGTPDQYSESMLYGDVVAEPVVISKPGQYRVEWAQNTVSATGAEVVINVKAYRLDQTSGAHIAVSGTSEIIHTQKVAGSTTTIAYPAAAIQINPSGVDPNNPDTYVYVEVEAITKNTMRWKNFDNAFVPMFKNMVTGETKHMIPKYEAMETIVASYPPLKVVSPTPIKIKHNFVLTACQSQNGECRDQFIYMIARYENGQVATTTTGRQAYFRYRLGAEGNVVQVRQLEGSSFDNSPIVSTADSQIDIPAGKILSLEYTTDKYVVASVLNHYQNNTGDLITGNIAAFAATPAAGTSGATTMNIPNGIRANIGTKTTFELGLGLLYKNWGQFAYKGAAPDEDFKPIEQPFVSRVAISGISSVNPSPKEKQKMEELMKTPKEEIESMSFDFEQEKIMVGGNEVEINQNMLEAAKHFTMLRSDRALGGWSSHAHLYVKPTKMAPYLRVDNGGVLPMLPVQQPSAVGQYGAVSIVKEHTSESKSQGYSLTFYGIGGGQTRSEATSRQLNDYMDVNGDGYPDIIGDKIQLTTSRGGLGLPASSASFWNVNVLGSTSSTGEGQSAGGSPAHIMAWAGANGSFNNVKVGNNSSFVENIGISGSQFETTTLPEKVMVDINGDGLPDIIKPGNVVEFNNARGFAASTWANYGAPSRSVTKSFALGANVSGFSQFKDLLPSSMVSDIIGQSNLDLAFGFSGSRSATHSKNDFIDFNGDGLPDYIDNGLISFNTGTNHNGGNYSLPRLAESSSSSFGSTINGSILIPIAIPIAGIVIKVGGGGGKSQGSTYNEENVSLRDFNGDGYVDIVETPSDDIIRVQLSKIGRTNMLKKITNPTGSTIEMDYGTANPITGDNIGSTYAMPFKKWVLKSVKVYDGYAGDGEDVQQYAYEYGMGYKDRRERKFLGFGVVRSHQLNKSGQVYRTHEQNYMLVDVDPKKIYLQGTTSDSRMWQYLGNLIKMERTLDGTGREIDRKDYEYRSYSIGGTNAPTLYQTDASGYVAPTCTDLTRILTLPTKVTSYVFHYNGAQTSPSYPQQKEEYFDLYDKYGNLLKYRENPNYDNNIVEIGYHYLDNASLYVVNVPALHKVSSRRYTTTSIDAKGQVIAINRYKSGTGVGDMATTNLEYDALGNLTKVTMPRPQMTTGNRMTYTYTYDALFRQYPIKVVDAYGYSSETAYNHFGKPVRQKDLNGVELIYGYDAARRNTFYKGPYNTTWTLKNEFKKGADGLYYAITRHNIKDEVLAAGEQIFHTSSFADGLGRIIQTKKQLDLKPTCTGSTGYRFATSGRQVYDEFGRIVQSFLGQEEFDCAGVFTPALSTKKVLTHADQEKTSYVYDMRDRMVQQHVHGLNATTKFDYGFELDNVIGRNLSFEKVTLPEGNISYTYKDEKDRVRVTKQSDGIKDLRTQYDYDILSQLTKVTDMENKVTTYEYDDLGRKTKTVHPDSGTSLFTYDLTNKLTTSQNQNMLSQNVNQKIVYNYNYDRLTSIVYPAFTTNGQSIPSHTVNYTYGANAAPDYAAGRITQITDLTGTRNMKYGKLGEVVEETRTLTNASSGNLYFKTNFRYDSWGRIMEMTYPDGEKLTYTYNRAAQLTNITNDQGQVYLKNVEYNYFDQPTRIVYGNDVVTINDYDLTQRVRAMKLERPNQSTFMNNEYSYDKNQNIISIVNSASQHDILQLGGIFDKMFTYDKFNRLASSTTQWDGYNESHYHTLDMNYNGVHAIASKKQVHKVTTPTYNGPSDNNYNAEYTYNAGKSSVNKIAYTGLPGGASAVSTFTYDPNGNMTGYTTNYGAFSNRKMIWDQQNRLMAVVDDNTKVNHYVYDHAGERTFKSIGAVTQVNIGGAGIYSVLNFDNYLVYPSGYMVVDIGKDQYSKHYYINGKRFASRLDEGAGQFTGMRAKGLGNVQDTADTAAQTDGMDFTSTLGIQNTTYNIAPGNDENNCKQQLQALFESYQQLNQSEPTGRYQECQEKMESLLQEALTGAMTYCEAFQEANKYVCEPVDPNNPPTNEPDPMNPPNPTTGEQTQADCLTELNALIAKYTAQMQVIGSGVIFEWYKCVDICITKVLQNNTNAKACWERFKIDGVWLPGCDTYITECGCGPKPELTEYRSCPAMALIYIDMNLKPDLSNACAVKAYVESKYKCVREPLPGETAPPTPPVTVDPWTPDPDSNTPPPDEDYDETKRKPIWWYHTDHLGSSTYLTDNFGRPTHYYDNMPFGETMVEHNQSTFGKGKYDNAYKFNGKELDASTGMYYYGARYYDPRISIFVSVDPKVHETKTPYQYVSNNPIMRIDPTGMNDHDYKKSKETGRLTIVPGSKDNPEYDRIIDDQGNTLKVDKGVINSETQQVKHTAFANGQKTSVTYDAYKFTDKEKAYEFYEFMSNRETNWVEFSLSDVTSSSGQNFYNVGTIGEQLQEAAWGILFDNEYAKDKGVKLNVLRHYHPWNPGPSDADLQGKKMFHLKYPNQETKYLIDCKECEFDAKTQKAKPRSETPY